MRFSATDVLSLLALLSGLFGGKGGKKKQTALALLPLVQDAIAQWETGIVGLRLREAAKNDPALEQFEKTLNAIYEAARSLKK